MQPHAVDNPHWPEGNGTSALAAAPHLDGPFLVLMCDARLDDLGWQPDVVLERLAQVTPAFQV